MSTETRDALRDHRRELRTEAGRAAYEAVREVVWYGVRDRFPGSLDLVAYVGDRLLELEDAALRATDAPVAEGLHCEGCAGWVEPSYLARIDCPGIALATPEPDA